MKRRAFLAGLAASAPFGAQAKTVLSNAQALSGDRFTADSAEFLLADIAAPPLYTLAEETPAHFADAREALQRALSGAIEAEDVLPPTRWGVRVVTARLQGATQTLQETLIAQGAARVAPQTDDHDLIKRLLQLEATARAARRGLWTLADYRIFSADAAWGAVGGFHLVEGTVARASLIGGRFYLNYGEDYRTDFTAGVAGGLYRRWTEAGEDFSTLAGARIRVRGLVETINGPSIDLKHSLQVERLV